MVNTNIETTVIVEPEPGSDKKVLIYMNYGASYTTTSGIRFTGEHPYQLVLPSEAVFLLRDDRFRRGRASDLKAYYQVDRPEDLTALVNGDLVKIEEDE